MRRLSVWTGVALCVLTVAACAESPAGEPPPSAEASPPATELVRGDDARLLAEIAPGAPPVGQTDRVRVARWTPAPDAPRMAALATGALAIVDGCLGLNLGDGASMIVAFPYDAVWDAAAQTLTFEGKTHALGDTVALGGGSVEPDTYRQGLGRHDFPPCVADRVWLTG